MFEMVIYHDKTVKVTSKNCDKFIYYIDRVIASAMHSVKLLVKQKLSFMSLMEKLFFAGSFKALVNASASVAFKSACKITRFYSVNHYAVVFI
jgi:hypothetical protein